MSSGVAWVVGTLIVLGILFILLTIYYAVRGLKIRPEGGREGLVGEVGEARTDLNPEGQVLVHGEWWNARANEHIPEGSKVKVVKTEKMMLRVVRAPDDA
jgi:membrane-bound serine protease (ClpP class)